MRDYLMKTHQNRGGDGRKLKEGDAEIEEAALGFFFPREKIILVREPLEC